MPNLCFLIVFVIACLLLVYIPFAMLFKDKLAKLLPSAAIARLIVMFVALGLVTVAVMFTYDAMATAWGWVVGIVSILLAFLALFANAVDPGSEHSSKFWIWCEELNSGTFVSALAVVLAFISLGVLIAS